MKLTPNMEQLLERLQLVCDLKKDVSPKDNNEVKEIEFVLRNLRREIEQAEFTLNIIYDSEGEHIDETMDRVITQIKDELGQQDIQVVQHPIKEVSSKRMASISTQEEISSKHGSSLKYNWFGENIK